MFMIHPKKDNTISDLHYILGDWYIKKIVFNKTFEYTAAVRGYPYGKPKENEVLICQFENGNSYDMFVISNCDLRGTMVGLLPCKVSHVTKFIIGRGATLSLMATGTHYHISPLVWIGDPMQSISFHARDLPKSSLIGKI